jgi:uncharacterized protein YdaU (DUF1376 family)
MSFDWYKRNASDSLRFAEQLTLEQAGALVIITDTIHVFGRPLVDDDRRIAGVLRVDTRKWQAIKRRLLAVGAIAIEGELLDVPAMIQPR